MIRGAVFAVLPALAALQATAAAQHEHHGAPANTAQVLLTGTASCAEGTALGSAIVQLVDLAGPDRHVIASSVVDTTGRFTVRSGTGTYTLEISAQALAPHRQQVTVANAPLNLGNVRIQCSAVELSAVTVRGERDAFQLRSGATIMEPRASAAASGSIAEFLGTVPGMALDADGRISIRNSTSVLVMMNGRRMPLSGEALVAFLRQMPATALERVEVGTSPTARQDANGTAGVVNLVFRDHEARRSGVRSIAGSIATGDHYMGSVAATGNVGDAVDWDAMYSLSATRPTTDSRTLRWSELPGDLSLHTDENSHARAEHRLHSVLAGAAAMPTPNTSLTLRGAYSWMEGSFRNNSAFNYRDAAGNKGTSTVGSLLDHVIPSAELSVGASVGRDRIRYAFEARTSRVNEDFRGDYDDVVGGYRYMSTAMASRLGEHTLRNDLGLRFSGFNVDAGHESRFRTITATHDATHFNAMASQAYRYVTEVHAGYVTAYRSTGRVRVEGGLRVEADRTNIRLETASARTDVRFFPSISSEWTDVRRAVVYRLAYGRRINRPTAEMLNPFSMGEDDMNEIIGNPDLVPEVADQVEFGLTRYGAWLTLQFTPFLRWTRDPIRQFKATTASGGTTTTLKNLTRTQAVGSDAIVRARFADGTAVTLSGSVAWMETTASTLGSRGVYATARLTVDHRLAANTNVQLYAYRRSAQVIEQGEILPAFTSELALTQTIAAGRGRVTLRLRDPWGTDRLEFRVADATFSQVSRRRTERPVLSLFASWAVGGAPRAEIPDRREGPARIF